MMLTLDNLAHRYNCLPSEALGRASTLDIYVLDLSARYSKYQQDLAEGGKPQTRNYTQQELQQMMDRVRNNKERYSANKTKTNKK